MSVSPAELDSASSELVKSLSRVRGGPAHRVADLELRVAEWIQRAALSERWDIVADLSLALGRYLSRLGDRREGQAAARDAVTAAERHEGTAGGPRTLDALEGLGGLLLRERSLEARGVYTRVLTITERVHGPDAVAVAECLALCALTFEGRHYGSEAFATQESLALRARALCILEKQFPPDDVRLVSTVDALALARAASGDDTAAEALYRRAVALAERLPPGDYRVAGIESSLGLTLVRLEKRSEGLWFLERAVAHAAEADGDRDVSGTVMALIWLAQGLRDSGDAAGALAPLERAQALLTKEPSRKLSAWVLAHRVRALRVAGRDSEIAAAVADAIDAGADPGDIEEAFKRDARRGDVP